MAKKIKNMQPATPTRRDFLKNSSFIALGATVASTLAESGIKTAQAAVLPGAFAQGSDAIRVGVIGCGGRGTGAARNVLDAAPDVKIVAMADAFKDILDYSHTELTKTYGNRVDVPAERRFVGLDAYKQLLATDINYVILAAPPGFRPQHLRAAVDAGKHIFTEKPVAVDATGVRECLAIYEAALKKNLGIAAGTQRRHQKGYIETIKRIHDEDIGEIVAARAYWNQGELWDKPRQAEWSDVEWQMRNWLYFTWLSGDHIVEQHVHNLDVVNWAMRDHPIKALSLGGRQVRTATKHGHIFDHFATDYEYANGVHMMSMCRQQNNTTPSVTESIIGTRGKAQMDRYTITGKKSFRMREKEQDPYLQEHIDLIASLRAGKPINELKNVTESTLTAIMGRMSAYTGKEVTWEQALNSKENLVPANLAFGPMATPPVPMPGTTEIV